MAENELATIFQPSGFSKQKARWIKQSLERIREEMGELSLTRVSSLPATELLQAGSSLVLTVARPRPFSQSSSPPSKFAS